MSIETFIEKAKQGTDTDLHADRLKALGFGKSANVKLDKFYKVFNTETELHAYYAAQYPQCQFITIEALHELCKAMDLWIDLPAHYTGDVPAEQLPWLEVFKLNSNDAAKVKELLALTEFPIREEARDDFKIILENMIYFSYTYKPNVYWRVPLSAENPFPPRVSANYASLETYIAMDNRLLAMVREFCTSMFVVAPKVSFAVEKPWIERFNVRAKDAVEAANRAVSDPLIIRFCKGGALIIAAWDKEGEAILEAANRL